MTVRNERLCLQIEQSKKLSAIESLSKNKQGINGAVRFSTHVVTGYRQSMPSQRAGIDRGPAPKLQHVGEDLESILGTEGWRNFVSLMRNERFQVPATFGLISRHFTNAGDDVLLFGWELCAIQADLGSPRFQQSLCAGSR